MIDQIVEFFRIVNTGLSSKAGLELKLVNYEKCSFFNYDAGYFDFCKESLEVNDDNYIVLTLKNNLARISYVLWALSLIVKKALLTSNMQFPQVVYVSKREIYYSNVELYGSTSTVDRAVDDISSILCLPKFMLPIIPSSKGLFYSPIQLINQDNGLTLNSQYQVTLISADFEKNEFNVDQSNESNIKQLYEIDFVLVVEKDTIFQNIINNPYFQNEFSSRCILITGKGYPDCLTRRFVNKLVEFISSFRISRMLSPVTLLYFGDWDCYGIEIFMIYCFGTRSSCLENPMMCSRGMLWAGVLLSQLDQSDLINNAVDNDELARKMDESKRITTLLSHPCFSDKDWSGAIAKHYCRGDIYAANSHQITYESLCRINSQLNLMLKLNKKSEAESVIQKRPSQFAQIIREELQQFQL